MKQKTERNKGIVYAHKKYPELNNVDLGHIFPVDGKPLSRERVRQILKKYAEKPSNRFLRLFNFLCDVFYGIVQGDKR